MPMFKPMTPEQQKASDELQALVDKASAAFDAMSPVDQAIHRLQQRRSGGRGLRPLDRTPEQNAAGDAAVAAMPEFVLLEEVLRLRAEVNAAELAILLAVAALEAFNMKPENIVGAQAGCLILRIPTVVVQKATDTLTAIKAHRMGERG